MSAVAKAKPMVLRSQIMKLLAAGYAVAPSDGGWLASYQNSAGKMHEIGIFPDQKKAERACFGRRAFDLPKCAPSTRPGKLS